MNHWDCSERARYHIPIPEYATSEGDTRYYITSIGDREAYISSQILV
jgi:hypothetical protein